MRSQLMTASIGLLDGRSLVVDASVQSARHEEGGLGTAGVEDVDQPRGVLARAVIVCECEHARLGALPDDDARLGGAAHQLNGVGSRGGERRSGEEGRGNESFGKHLDG